MNYDVILKHLMTIAEIPLNVEDENFKRIIPLMFAYAENRIYREVDFLVTTTETLGTLIANDREVPLPETILVLRGLSVIAPLQQTWKTPLVGIELPTMRYTLERVSTEALDMFSQPHVIPFVLPLTPAPGVPKKYTLIGKVNPGFPQSLSYLVRFMPVPDQAYPVEYIGVVRPAPLSPTNTETYLSKVYPELLCAACMVFISGYQRDFGSQADDPAKAQSWETQYTTLRASAMAEAVRMRGDISGPRAA